MSSTLPTIAAHDPLIGQTVGGYLVEQPLGEGGMGLVYRARHPILNRHFAVKVLRPEVAANEWVSSNFVREAQTLSSLKHPHIIDIVGFGAVDEQRQYMVMEFLEGRTLEAELSQEGPLIPERALKVADQILDALSAAHSVEVVHRDLKPSNVFLARVSGGDELVKLLDFGLARQQPQALSAADSAKAGASVAAGTPEYIAPEQALGMQASRHSDLYSFGVMLFEMLTGELPFRVAFEQPDRIQSLLRMHVGLEAPSLSSSGGSLSFPAELEELVADLLKKNPAHRPSSAQTVRSRLQRVMRGVQQQATQQRRNPLLEEAVVAPRAGTPMMFEPLGELPPRRGKRGRWAALAVLPVLVGVVWSWAPGESPEVIDPLPVVAEPVVAAPVVAAPAVAAPAVAAPAVAAPAVAAPAVAAPAVAAPAVESDSDLLAPLNKRTRAPVKPAAARPTPAVSGATVEILKAQCEPNERWRQAARAHLQELQQVAAGSGDSKAWARFEAAEPVLSAAISRAGTGLECEAVDREIQQLAGKVTP